MGHKLSYDMKANNVVKAVRGAVKSRKTTKPLLRQRVTILFALSTGVIQK
jgi:hypothetical protein|tara:strand:- start:101 stop:250 length:150 start_codon:yes stop_codon:yes gene_type:complete